MGKDLIQKSLKDSLFTGIIALALFGPIVGLRTVAKNEVLVVEPKWLVVLMIRRPPRSTPLYSSAASDVYKRQGYIHPITICKWHERKDY